MTRAVTLAEIADTNTFVFDGINNRVGIASAIPTVTLDVAGIVSATTFYGDGSNLEGVSGGAGLGTALSDDETSPLNVFFKTPKQVTIGAGTSVTLESDATSGNVAFIRESIVHVAVGATFHIKTSNTLVTNVLSIF